MKAFVCLCAGMLMWTAGCSKTEPAGTDAKPAAAPKPQAKESTLNQSINYFTGKTAVDMGKKARTTIVNVSSQNQENIDQVLGKEPKKK